MVCREKTDKRRLIRIVRTPTNGVVIDSTGKQNGRGAYLCDKSVCWERAIKRNVLNNALKTTLSEREKEAIWADRPKSAETEQH